MAMYLSKQLLDHILYLGLLYFCVSCGTRLKDTEGNSVSDARVAGVSFVPDTAINNEIFLRSSSSIEKSVGDLMPSIAEEESLPVHV